MEEKKYEAGRVEISSAEYRDLVTEAVKAQNDASDARSRMWKAESERDQLAKELEETRKNVAELKSVLASLQASVPSPNTTPWWNPLTCKTNDDINNI